eukprot:CCRYP_015061-RA/>CCRYP_015061-RA protein AED:0.43 eAED:0.43 QI:0/-1/0/1/-1/0/1/0/149
MHRFHHVTPPKRQDQPYPHTAPTYGAAQQYTHPPDTSPPLSKPDALFIKEVIGVFLYYARAVDCTMLPALGSLAAQQANPTQLTLSSSNTFLIMLLPTQMRWLHSTPVTWYLQSTATRCTCPKLRRAVVPVAISSWLPTMCFQLTTGPS